MHNQTAQPPHHLTLDAFTKHYFDLFALPFTFNINLEQLEKNYKIQQIKAHPDQFTQKNMQLWATRYLAHLYTAKQTLMHIDKRAIYWCKIHHIELSAQQNALPQTVMAMFDWQEGMQSNSTNPAIIQAIAEHSQFLISNFLTSFAQVQLNISLNTNCNEALNKAKATLQLYVKSLELLENFKRKYL